MQTISIGGVGDGTMTVMLRGEVDFTNAAPLVDAVRGAVAERCPTAVLVDIVEVTFLDSSGMSMLVHAMRAAREVGAEFRVERPSDRVFDQLRLAGLLEAFGLGIASDDG
ncbi:STAS domain-containing protein [Virgisporangium aurantiacum]|uniref:Anti-sigma factor antagonist n=1 Tax=Virgisporangium aurantiacum TaxID=175570 RepID=A0A8J3ZDT0_9ACTN|nr:STAS domain-containing protein [Virgisporangium aurantiacum]GIJ62147.1 hypothetical protein Vau01_096630 [Virgisporangium aurantiacum]